MSYLVDHHHKVANEDFGEEVYTVSVRFSGSSSQKWIPFISATLPRESSFACEGFRPLRVQYTEDYPNPHYVRAYHPALRAPEEYRVDTESYNQFRKVMRLDSDDNNNNSNSNEVGSFQKAHVSTEVLVGWFAIMITRLGAGCEFLNPPKNRSQRS
jgi:hypothetical protein